MTTKAATPRCDYCGPLPVELQPWSPYIFVWFCPCCSSRWHGGSMERFHWGSHNDYATYMCDPVMGLH